MERRKTTAGLLVVIALFLSACTTTLLNSNTLDLAATVDDLAVRQVVYNLAKTQANKYALPSQVQINGGSLTARTGITPSATTPFDAALTSTSQVAAQVVAASKALTTTTTNMANQNVPSSGASLSGVIEDQKTWSIVPVQDPEQLRRLRILYQYGTQQIDRAYLLCLYPVPEVQEKQNTNGGQAAAKNAPAKNPGKPTIYIRGDMRGSCYNSSKSEEPNALGRRVDWVKVGRNPNPAFLKSPGCILCAWPNERFKNKLVGTQIYEDTVSNVHEPYNPSKYNYVPVVINDNLIPNDYNGASYIDWMLVLKDGPVLPPGKWRAVGSSNGYTVFTNNDQKFSEFVLAIVEATLEPTYKDKSLAPAPNVVQTPPLR